MRAASLVLLVFAPTAAACGDDATSPADTVGPDGDPTADVAPTDADGAEDTGPPAPADLGAPCPMGCNLETCVDSDSDCEALCLFDGRTRPAVTYCSLPCIDTCPPGYECLAPADALFEGLDTKVCMALPAECGNEIVERTEACDDGNTDDGDRCAADCSRETLPTTAGRVTMSINGGPPFTFEGAKEGGFAQLLSSGALVWSESNSVEMFGLELPGIGDRTSADGNQLAEVLIAPLPCNFRGTALFTLTSFDPETRHIAGRFELLTACLFNCFDCGGDGAERTVTVEFDMVWLDRPDL